MRMCIVFVAVTLCAGCVFSRIVKKEAHVAEQQNQLVASENKNSLISVVVIGEVTSPGSYRLPSSAYLSRAVEADGGIGGDGLETKVHVTGKDTKHYQVNLREIRKGLEQDFELQDGDVIVVPGHKPRL